MRKRQAKKIAAKVLAGEWHGPSHKACKACRQAIALPIVRAMLNFSRNAERAAAAMREGLKLAAVRLQLASIRIGHAGNLMRVPQMDVQPIEGPRHPDHAAIKAAVDQSICHSLGIPPVLFTGKEAAHDSSPPRLP